MAEKMCRSFCGVLYPESETYKIDNVLGTLDDIFDMWGYVLHDKDLDNDGQIKKSHIHWVGQSNNPTRLSTVSNRLGIPAQYIEYVNKFKSAVRYLLHLDSPNKYQYPQSCLVSNGYFDKYFVNGEESEMSDVAEIMNYLNESGCTSIEELSCWCLSSKLWTTYRRNANVFKAIIMERKQSVKFNMRERRLE